MSYVRLSSEMKDINGVKVVKSFRNMMLANAANAANAAKTAKSAKTADSADIMKIAKLAKSATIGIHGFNKGRKERVNKANKCDNDINSRSVYSDFIFFGCWNNINCKKESGYIYRDIVLDYIHRNEEDINQLYIAGDNWYTNIKDIQSQNYKVYLTDILTSGYAKLYLMNKDIYIAVGNHDEDKDAKIITNGLKKDCNINTQKYYLKKIKEGRLTGEDEPTLELLNSLANNRKLSDLNLCEKGVYIYADDIGVRYNKGNIVIIINTNNFDNYNYGLFYLETVKSKINEVIEAKRKAKSKDQIFVMGHIPLFTFKKDKISLNKINKEAPRFDKFVLELFNIFVKHNIIYICADTHNFSIMKIKFKDSNGNGNGNGSNASNNKVLIQITAGSGGADPDLLSTEYIETPATKEVIDEIYGNKYEIVAHALNSYGYVKIKTLPNNIEVCYKQIIKDTADKTAKHSGSDSSGSSDSGGAKKINEVTYTINKKDKLIKVKKYSHMLSMDLSIYKNTEKCNNIDNDYGYITSQDRSIACYMKKAK